MVADQSQVIDRLSDRKILLIKVGHQSQVSSVLDLYCKFLYLIKLFLYYIFNVGSKIHNNTYNDNDMLIVLRYFVFVTAISITRIWVMH